MLKNKARNGFTIIEVIVVLALVGVIFAALSPNFNILPSTQASVTLGRLASDVRNAFDVAVLTGRTHRIVFHIHSGKYWLEVAQDENFLIDRDKVNYDPSEDDEEEAQAVFDDLFKRYEELAGQEIFDPETEKKIKPESPVLKARDLLRPTKWKQVDYQEWGIRDLLPVFIISEILVEHLSSVQTLDRTPDQGRVMLYFFPQGYVERAQIKISFVTSDDRIDSSKQPYILQTHPYMGTIDILSENQELELKDAT